MFECPLSISWQAFNYGQKEKLYSVWHVKDYLVFAFFILKKIDKETVQDIDNCDKWHVIVLLY